MDKTRTSADKHGKSSSNPVRVMTRFVDLEFKQKLGRFCPRAKPSPGRNLMLDQHSLAADAAYSPTRHTAITGVRVECANDGQHDRTDRLLDIQHL